MLKSYLLSLYLIFSFNILLFGQQNNKLDLFSRSLIKSEKFQKNDLNLFVKGEAKAVENAVKKHGGYYKYGVDKYHHINIPLSKLESFLDEPAIIAVENADIPVVPLADTAIIKNNILPIHQGVLPLNQAYTGKDVILGIVDYGIWFDHEDFKKPNGESRIKFIWDQRVSNNNSPIPYNYGEEWNQVDIDQGNCTHYENPLTSVGHGTTVSGIAAGNGRATGHFSGMAPESDMIVVAFDFEATFLSGLIDGIDYIFKKADAMGKPCVINGSLGIYFGSRDGTDIASKIVDGLLDERCGRSVVMANGNAGGFNYHLGYEVNQDTSFTWFAYTNVLNNVSIQMWADTADFDSVFFQISADDPTVNPPLTKAATDFFNIKRDFNLGPGNLTGTISQNLVGVGNVIIRAELKEDGYYYLDFNIAASNSSDYWRLSTTGSGRFDTWGSSSLIGNSNIVQSVPSINDFPEIVNYKFPDNQMSMVSSIQASDKVISVGNYANRIDYTDIDTNLVITPEAAFVNQISPTSSLGPTRDGRIKPDISATGGTTIATGNLGQINLSKNSPTNRPKIAIGGMHYRNGGTSMASPVVAGFAALYLEKNPNACYREVKDVVINSAIQDVYTGNQLPDNTWGYGKLNGFEAIQLNYTYGCTDTSALNYQAGLDYDDGSCISKVYGCMDPFAINYDENANVSNDSCVYSIIDPNDTTSISISNNADIKVYPNPVKENKQIILEINNFEDFPLYFELKDITGKTVYETSVQNKITGISLKSATLQSALYFYSIRDGHTLIHQGKLTVQ